MNLQKAKKSLAECHITSTDNTQFFEDSGSRYLLQRAKEELEKLDQEMAVLNKKELKRRTKRIIQLLVILRVKEDGAVQKESDGTRRPGSKDTLSPGGLPQGS